MKISKILSFLLALLIAAAFAVSCGNQGQDASVPSAGDVSEDPASADGTSAPDSESSEEVSRGPLDHLEDMALNGETVTFLVENGSGSYIPVEIIPNEEKGAAYAPYVAERNNIVEEKLGCTIVERRTDNMADELRRAAASKPDFDIACPYMTTGAPLIIEGLFYDLYEFSDIINFDAPYWDQNADSDLTLGGKLYMTTGDFSLLTMDVTHVLIFSKGLVEKYGLESPYELVEKGEWTMDKMVEMAHQVTFDDNGEPGLQYTDTIGLLCNNNYANSFYIGSGEKFVAKDKNGVPVLAFEGERQTDVTKKIFDIFHDEMILNKENFNAQAIADGFENCYWAARDRLANDGALFCTTSLEGVFNLSMYDANFGLLITPKYAREQDRYYSYISVIYATGCVIPAGNEEPEKAALLLEALNAASTDTVKFNYYERIFKLQKVRDQEDSDMLDRIFASRVYDIGSIFNWGGARDFIMNVARGASFDYVSSLEASRGRMESQIQDTVDFFSGN
ncbi:MAG: extracellular solute-binding protein [Clostridia bacterium]|nr:extracellular solute-binding protein [Clostridia bacterium]